MGKKGRSQKQLRGNDIQSRPQGAEGRSEDDAAEPPDQSTLPPVVSVKTLARLMPPAIFSIKEMMGEIKISSSLSPRWKVF